MNPLERIFETARKEIQTIILPEGEDPRVQEAALRLTRERLARIVLLGNPERIRGSLEALGARSGEIAVVDPVAAPDLEEIAEAYSRFRAKQGITIEQARTAVANPLVQAAVRVRMGLADGTVGGAVATTAETVRVALQVIGRRPGITTVSSFFLMLPGAANAGARGEMIFADCGLIVDPDARELAAIARASAESCRNLLQQEPRVALLSFSTAGSAAHDSLLKIREALAIVRDVEPGLQIDGEIQVDAALDEGLRGRKAPDSPLRGAANVFIFPDLASGNIGYKIAQRLGGMTAIGPILQGLNNPANDLSRGCSVEDIVAAVVVTAVQALADAKQGS
jgi:phosphate acetyltransferase